MRHSASTAKTPSEMLLRTISNRSSHGGDAVENGLEPLVAWPFAGRKLAWAVCHWSLRH
jgi:hypothetical protein